MRSFLWTKKNSILTSFIISYILVFTLPLAVNAFLFNKSMDAVKAKIISVNTNTLNQIYSKTENILYETELSYSMSINNENNKKLLNTASHDKDAIQYLTSAILNTEFQNPIYSNTFNYFMYYKKPRIILTKNSRYTSDLSFNLINDYTDLTCSQVMSMLDQVTEKSVIKISDSLSVLAYPIYETNSSIITGVFSTYFSDSYISALKEELGGYDHNTSFIMVAPDNALLTINESNLESQTLYNATNSYWDIGNNVILSRKSDIANIKYALVSNESAFYHELRYTKSIILVQIILTVVFGIFIIYLSIKNNYTPVKEIVSLISQNSVKDPATNEYELIKNTIDQNIKELLSLRKEQVDTNTLLYKLSIRNILLGNIYTEQEYLECVSKYDFKIYSDDYCVMIIAIDNFEEMFADYSETDDSKSAEHIVKYAIENIITELGNTNNSVVTCELNDKIVCVLNINSGSPKDLALEIQRLIKLYLKVDISAAISSVHKSYAMIPTCYLEANTAMEHIFLSESESIICYDDIPISPTEYTFSLEEEITLIDAIKSGNYDAACKVINSLFDGKSTHSRMDKFIIFDIAGAVLKSIDAANKIYCYDEDVNFDNNLILNEISSHNTFGEARIKLLNIIKQFCDIVNEHKISKNSQLINEIIAYVDDHFQKYDLSVSKIADVLNRNPTYISRHFKEQTGVGLLDYINSKRIEHAKALLAQNLSINDIASMCGFANTPSFIRVFKKYMGVSPGKYRDDLI